MTRIVAGRIHRPGEGVRDGWLAIDAGRVVDEGEGAPPRKPDAEGLVLAAPVNAHTHVGDLVARGVDVTGMTLAQVVAPPDGLKHRLLRERPPTRASMAAATREVAASGARSFIDFREGGEEGARILAGEPGARVFGRCAGAWDPDEAARVLDVADGLGLSAMKDAPADVPEAAAQLAHARKKGFALHLSEDAREDVARAIALRPDFVVHCVKATRADVRALADARVPIVVCPRSNARFGPLPDVAAMLEEGATIALGTDNAMFGSLDVLDDARFLLDRGLAPESLLDALTAGGATALRETHRSWLRRGDDGRVVVLPPGDPLARAA